MATYGQVISQIRSPLTRGIASDDERLSPRYIIGVASRKRSILIRRERERNILDRTTSQRINCYPLVKAKKHECPCAPEDLGCYILRTEEKLPALINDMVYTVSSSDGSTVYDPTTFSNVKNSAFARIKALRTTPRYYISNGYIYVVTPKNPGYISIEGVFEDPLAIDLINSRSCDDPTVYEDCTSAYEREFPIDSYLLDAVVTMSLEEISKAWKQGNEDQVNDSRDEERNEE